VYFLATNVIFTADEPSREAALAGAKYLDNAADTAGGGRRIFHHEKGGEDLFYLSWCHGPAGAARTYYRMHQLTGEQRWLDAMFEAAHTLETCGLPAARTPGYWDNVGVCCGGAGVMDFYMDLYTLTHDEKWRTLAETLADDLVERATADDRGMRWIQAEHRTKPDDRRAQVGLMQGAAGVGRALLRIEAMARRCDCLVKLPDTPF
jgi:lantibiotic modifying enzyme